MSPNDINRLDLFVGSMATERKGIFKARVLDGAGSRPGNPYVWSRLLTPSGPLFESFIEILKGIEPNTIPVGGLVSYDPKNYRCYVACHSGRVGAIAIGCYFPKKKNLHVEDYALSPHIYGKGLAEALWEAWLEFIWLEWPEVREAMSLTIEVYLKNVQPWKKIMRVEEVKVSNKAIFISEATPIIFMARNLSALDANDIYREWQDYQRVFYPALLKEKLRNNLDENIRNIIKYCSGLIGKPYVWWKGGIFTDKNIGPLWSCDGPPPDKKDIDVINCSGLINLGLRSIGLSLPIATTDGSKGGTLAYQEHYKSVAEAFDSKKIYPVGTLIGRRYNKSGKDQGHLAIIIENNYVLQSCHSDGVNNIYTLEKSNESEDGGDYYDYVVLPQNWLQREKPKPTSTPRKRLDRIMSHLPHSDLAAFSTPSASECTGVGTSGKRTGLVWHELFSWFNPGMIYSGQFPAEISEAKRIFIQGGDSFDKDCTARSVSLIKVCLEEELYWIKPKIASVEQLQYVHDIEYIRKIERLNSTSGEAGEFTSIGIGCGDIAKLAVGGVIDAIDAVVQKVIKNAYCLIRPSGHHALADKAMGFCIYNNIAIGAKYVQKKYGYRRVVLVDWDAHHGNSTQKTFWHDDSVLYISTHQDSCYPPDSGSIHETGEGKGVGFNINIPFPPGSGHGAYEEAWRRIIIPAIDAFVPDIIMVSCGLNASAMDPMSRIMLSSGAFVTFTNHLMILADRHCEGRLVLVSEGGYSSATMGFGVLSIIETLMERKTKTVDPYRSEIENYGGHTCTIQQRAVIDAVIDRHISIAKTPLLSPRTITD